MEYDMIVVQRRQVPLIMHSNHASQHMASSWSHQTSLLLLLLTVRCKSSMPYASRAENLELRPTWARRICTDWAVADRLPIQLGREDNLRVAHVPQCKQPVNRYLTSVQLSRSKGCFPAAMVDVPDKMHTCSAESERHRDVRRHCLCVCIGENWRNRRSTVE